MYVLSLNILTQLRFYSIEKLPKDVIFYDTLLSEYGGCKLQYFLCMKQWQAVVFPLSLTCLMYAGSLVHKSLLLIGSCSRYIDSVGGFSFECVKYACQSLHDRAISVASNVYSWRTYVVVSILLILFTIMELQCGSCAFPLP